MAWSQILFDSEVLMALNSHGLEDRGAEITVDSSLHPEGSEMNFLYRSDWDDEELKNPPAEQGVMVQRRGERAVIRLDLPPSGMAILV